MEELGYRGKVGDLLVLYWVYSTKDHPLNSPQLLFFLLSISDVTVLAAAQHTNFDGARLCVLHLTQLTPSRPINSLLISHSNHNHLTHRPKNTYVAPKHIHTRFRPLVCLKPGALMIPLLFTGL